MYSFYMRTKVTTNTQNINLDDLKTRQYLVYSFNILLMQRVKIFQSKREKDYLPAKNKQLRNKEK